MLDRQVAELHKAMDRIWEIAEGFGLDAFPIHFEIVPPSIMYEFGAYGIPGRFSHWTHGKAYHQLKTMYDYGLSKIYELVINANPSYAFLMDGNSLLQNKLVVAHVIGHGDFFKNNTYFKQTSRQMIETASLNAERIRRYEFQHGKVAVESFLDSVLSIQEHIDPNVFMRKKPKGPREKKAHETAYDDLFELAGQQEEEEHGQEEATQRLPAEPEKDVLHFLMERAALKEWQQDIIGIVRAEMLYFLPQMQTKIMNEGWASLWHARIMRALSLSEDEYVEFAHLHSSVLSPSKRQVNPYYIGMKIFEDIERRWDSPSAEDKEKFSRKGAEGRQKLFEARELESDVSFLRNYLTKELVDDLDLYIYKQEGRELKIVEKDWEKVRETLISSMTNFGNPYIVVEDADHKRNSELYLKHWHEGADLDVDYAERTLRHIHNIWQRPVHLETVLRDKKTLLTFDGSANSKTVLA